MSDGVAPTKNTKNMQVESYQRIRSAIGALAVLLPIVLFLSTGLESVQFVPSISEFYYTPAREILVGTIGAIAVFFDQLQRLLDQRRSGGKRLAGTLANR